MAFSFPPLAEEKFSHFLPFRHLSPVEKALVARRLRLQAFKPGEVIARIGERDTDEIFLLSGKIALIAQDEGMRSVQAGSASALGALAQLRPRKYRVQAITATEVVLAPLDIMPYLLQAEGPAQALDALELDPEDVDDRLYARLLSDIRGGSLKLPITRAGAMAIRALASNPGAPLSQLGQAALIEPVVAARLVAAANHPLAANPRPLQNPFSAAATLGQETTRRLLLSFTAPQFIPDRYSPIFGRFSAAVRQSREVASLCAQLAELSDTLVAAQAYLIGLLHVIGDIVTLAYAESDLALCMDERALEACLRRMSPMLSATLLREFGFNSDVVLAATSASDWLRESESGLEYADLVVLARMHSLMGTEHARLVPPLHSLPAFARLLDGQLSPAKSLSMIRAARAQADQAKLPDWHTAVA